ncbi:MAG: alpha/beta hydrolase, partial [Muribaculaceae bacterium]|nr:alpha/beta hydrolase [Muribaculaceae bacterium]
DIPIGVLGHSEGGSVAIRLGAHNPLCEFIITLAAPAWRGDSIIMSQARALAENASGNWSAENATLQRRLLDICLSPIPSALARPVFISTMTKEAGSAGTLPQVQASIAASADAMLSKWYREFLRYDPSDDISSVRVPWLALNGDRDQQVVPENLETIRHLNPGASVRLIPMHNHLFQKCTTGSPAEYARITESISGETLAAIVEWLDTNIVKK